MKRSVYYKKLDPKRIGKRIMQIGLKTQCGHIASAMSCVNVLCDTYNKWPDAIIILSKGHGALAQYVILNELGKLPNKVLDTYYKDGGLSGHATLAPEYGIYASTGSLGHGLAIGIGYAIANPDKLVVVILSDGELDEGSTWEALRTINRLRINNICILVDDNGFQGLGMTNNYGTIGLMNYISSHKGEGWGELENTFESHYAKVSEQLYKQWEKSCEKNL